MKDQYGNTGLVGNAIAPSKSRVDNAIENVYIGLDQQLDLINLLEEKLHKSLEPDYKAYAVGGIKAPDDCSAEASDDSPIVITLQTYFDSINNKNNRLKDLISRIQL